MNSPETINYCLSESLVFVRVIVVSGHIYVLIVSAKKIFSIKYFEHEFREEEMVCAVPTVLAYLAKLGTFYHFSVHI